MPPAPRFIAVSDLLVDIAHAVGEGHRRLVASSHTPIGTLVVKEAAIKVNFEMTSSATHRTDSISAQGPALGAKTLSFGATTSSAQTEDRLTNRAEVTLTIVNVAAEAADTKLHPALKPAGGTKVDPAIKARPGAAPAGPTPADRDRLITAIGQLEAALKGSRVSRAAKKELREILDRARDLAHQGDLEGSARAIVEFTARMKTLTP